jgi:hypothetical protein
MGSVASVDNLVVGFYFIMNDFIVVNSELLKIDVGGILKSLITGNDKRGRPAHGQPSALDGKSEGKFNC